MREPGNPTSPPRAVVLRNGVGIEDPLAVVLGLLRGGGQFDVSDRADATPFGESDVRRANRGGARISSAEMAAILERARAIRRALRVITPDASLAGTEEEVPWLPLGRLFDAFVDIRGVGFSKMTKILHPKRPALIPMLDSIVQRYLTEEDRGAQAAFGERALWLVRGYKRDMDNNRPALRALRRELAELGFGLTEVRILDLLILSAEIAPAKRKS